MGLVFHRYRLPKEAFYVLLFMVLVLIMVLGVRRKIQVNDSMNSMFFFLIIMILFASIGYQLYGFHIEKEPLSIYKNQDYKLEAYVKTAHERDFATDYEILSQVIIINGQKKDFRERQNLRIYGINQDFDSGDRIRVSNPSAKPVSGENSKVTSYELYLKSRGIHNRLQADISNVELMVSEGLYQENFLFRSSSRVMEFLDGSLQEPQNQLMKSVLFGHRGFLDEDLQEAFSQTGTAHIIAVSGLHVGILVIVFMTLFKILGLSKSVYLWLILGVLFFYGYLIDYPTSMLRAGMMYGLYIIAFYENRPYDGLHALGIVGVLSLIINPLSLFTVSFQLSFMATATIFLFHSKIQKILFFLPSFLRGLIAVTLSAQIGTFPLMAYYFGQISIVSIFANIFLMPTMGLLLSLGIAGISLSFLSLPLGMAVNNLTNGLLTYQIGLVRFFQKVPGAYLELSSVHFLWVVLYYIILIGGYFLFLKNVAFYRKEDLKNEMERL